MRAPALRAACRVSLLHTGCEYEGGARADLLVTLVKDSLSKMVRTIFASLNEPPPGSSDTPLPPRTAHNGIPEAPEDLAERTRSHALAGAIDALHMHDDEAVEAGNGKGGGGAPAVRGYGVQCADSILLFFVRLLEARTPRNCVHFS